MRKETILLITTFHSADRIWIIWNFLEKSFRTVYMNDFVCSLLFVHLPKWVLGFRWVVVWTGTWGLVYLLGKVYPLSRWYIPQGMFATLLIFHMLSFPMFVLYSFSSSLGIVYYAGCFKKCTQIIIAPQQDQFQRLLPTFIQIIELTEQEETEYWCVVSAVFEGKTITSDVSNSIYEERSSFNSNSTLVDTGINHKVYSGLTHAIEVHSLST